MAGIGRNSLIAWLVTLGLGAATGAHAATIFIDPGVPEDLIFDARLSPVIPRSTPAEAMAEKSDLLSSLKSAAEIAQCALTGAGTASALGPGTGFVAAVSMCGAAPDRPIRQPPAAFSFGMASLGPAVAAPPPSVQPIQLPYQPPRALAPAPVPLPAPALTLLMALGALLGLRRR